jgi:hypothetical protein
MAWPRKFPATGSATHFVTMVTKPASFRQFAGSLRTAVRGALGHRHRAHYTGRMVTPLNYGEPQPAFVMQDDDRFHKIITSGDLRFAKTDKSTTVITLFAIRRATGMYDFYVVHKVFLPADEVSRSVQSKVGLTRAELPVIELAIAFSEV